VNNDFLQFLNALDKGNINYNNC